MLSAEQQAEWGRLQEEAGAKTAQVPRLMFGFRIREAQQQLSELVEPPPPPGWSSAVCQATSVKEIRVVLSAEQQAERGRLQEGPGSKAAQVQGCACHDRRTIAQGVGMSRPSSSIAMH